MRIDRPSFELDVLQGFLFFCSVCSLWILTFNWENEVELEVFCPENGTWNQSPIYFLSSTIFWPAAPTKTERLIW